MSEEKKEMKKSSSPAKDLTVGSPMKLILGFAFPMFLGLLFQQFYSLVDTMIVGKYLGVDPFAGVGSTGSLNFIVIGFCMGLCSVTDAVVVPLMVIVPSESAVTVAPLFASFLG